MASHKWQVTKKLPNVEKMSPSLLKRLHRRTKKKSSGNGHAIEIRLVLDIHETLALYKAGIPLLSE
jgi:hypothetical protein